MARACVFCGGTPTTNEHIWSEWIGEALASGAPFNIKSPWGLRQAPSINQTVKQVCSKCNNGWMSDLEGATKPILRPMALGETGSQHRLDQRAQRTLATWAVLKAIMFATLHPKGSPVTNDEYRRFYESRRPSGGITLVFIAAYMGSKWAARSNVKLLNPLQQMDRDSRAPAAGYLVTFTVFRVVFQVFDYFAEDSVQWHDDRRFVQCIWPPQRDVMWPWQGVAFNDDALDLVENPNMVIERDGDRFRISLPSLDDEVLKPNQRLD